MSQDQFIDLPQHILGHIIETSSTLSKKHAANNVELSKAYLDLEIAARKIHLIQEQHNERN